MLPSTMRQVTILQLGPNELTNLRDGDLLKIPISPEMAVLLHEGKGELYLSLVGVRKQAKRDVIAEVQTAELPTNHHHRGPIIKWSDEEAYKVLMQYDKLDASLGIGKRLQLAQKVVLPPERHRLFESTGKTTLEGLRKKAVTYAKTVITPPTSTPPAQEPEYHKCFVTGCDGSSKTSGGLAGHISASHSKRLPKVNGVTHFQCRECKDKKVVLPTWAEFLGHLQTIHGKK